MKTLRLFLPQREQEAKSDQVTVVYGSRRVGKTTLVSEFTTTYPNASVQSITSADFDSFLRFNG